MATSEDKELKQRLGLYQVFLKLYDHHRSLLDEIFKLENIASPSLTGVAPRYVQGVVQGQQVYLITNLPAGETQSIIQSQRIWIIGRTSTCAIPIADKQLSRRHAAIQYIDHKGFYLIDFSSTNGTFVNGEPITQRLLLKDGDKVRLGSVAFSFFIANTRNAVAAVPQEVIAQLSITNSTQEKEVFVAAHEADAHEGVENPIEFDLEPEIPTAPVEEISLVKKPGEDTSLFLKRQRSIQKQPETPTLPQVDKVQQSEILDRFLSRQRHDEPS